MITVLCGKLVVALVAP
nr:hypothetical protein [Vibrio cincinnatiensis]